ncbi:MAG: peptidase S24 [Bacteroidales bacterium]|jgi:phage repressor protein C with HTH and peptisase S24 domain|nr:peptidase S24 [Bacteroidales bacterium]
MDIYNRIKSVIKWLIGNGFGNSQMDIGRLLGYSNKSSFSQVINGKVPLPGDFIDRLSSISGNINKVWIVDGVGDMLMSNDSVGINNYKLYEEKEYDKQLNFFEEKNISGAKAIPLIPIDAMAGYMKGELKIMEYECEYYIIPIFKDAEFLIQVRGSSMTPKYNSGDIVACKRLNLNDIFFQWNKVYVIDTDQGALIKRIKKSTNESHILLVSENKDYDSFELSKSQINSIAMVVGVIRLE